MTAGNLEIYFGPINDNDMKLFRQYSSNKLKTTCILTGLCNIALIPWVGVMANKLHINVGLCGVIFEVLYLILALCPWWLLYLGEPKGILTGYIEAQHYEADDEGTGIYKYDIYFPDINKRLYDVAIGRIGCTWRYETVNMKDQIKVVRSWTGELIFMK